MPVDIRPRAATLQSLFPQTPGILTLRFDISTNYRPGQSIQITFPGDNKRRFYSISSSPSEGPYIEITVKSEPGSTLEKALAALKSGDTLDFAGPMGGALSLPDGVHDPIAFIAAGTGVTPFRSMIRFLIDQPSSFKFWLFHSARSQAELLFRDEFKSWSKADQNFRYVPTLTRDFDNHWKNETGRINDEIIRKHVLADPCTFLLCGPASFVSDMDGVLQQKLNIPKDRIRREK